MSIEFLQKSKLKTAYFGASYLTSVKAKVSPKVGALLILQNWPNFAQNRSAKCLNIDNFQKIVIAKIFENKEFCSQHIQLHESSIK